MPWDNCILHIILALASYLFWLVAALSAAVYFVIHRIELPSSSDTAEKAEGPLNNYVEELRHKLTVTYLLLGLLLFSGALVAGFLKVNIYWSNYRPWEIKIIFSLIILLYYFAVLVAIPILRLKKYEKTKWLTSILAITGIAFIALNFVASSLSELHHYL